MNDKDIGVRIDILQQHLEELRQYAPVSGRSKGKSARALAGAEAAIEKLEEMSEDLGATSQGTMENKRCYRELIEFSLDGYLVTDLDGDILEANRAASILLNRPVSQLVHKPLVDLAVKEARASLLGMLGKLRRGQRVRNATLLMQRHPDESFVASFAVVPVRDENGKVADLRWVIRDLTDRKLVDTRLQESAELSRVLLDSLPHPAILVGRDRTILTTNRFARQMGAKVGEYCWQSVHGCQFIPEHERSHANQSAEPRPDDTPPSLCQLDKVIEDQAPHIIQDIEVSDKIWDYYWVPLDEGTCLHYCIDVTDRKRTEQELRISEEKYRLLVENQNELVVKIDTEGRFLFVSATYCKMFGKTESELLGKKFMPFIHQEDREETARAMEDLYRPPYTCSSEQREMTKDGLRWLGWTAKAIRDEHDEVTAIVAVGRDITKRKRAEQAFQLSHKFLEIANRHIEMAPLLKEFVTGVKDFTGSDAVGIRMLDEDGNIPYQVFDGFSREFYDCESLLSIKSDKCMCVNVIRGDTDPELPFYTKGGSFYINGTSQFLATASSPEKGQNRNRCNEEGYESIALVPIRTGDRITGLIHIADVRENIMPLEVIEAIERTAMQLGTAIQRVRAEEAQRISEERFRSLVETIPHGIEEIDTKGVITFVNRAFYEMLGYQDGELLGMAVAELASDDSERRRVNMEIESILRDQPTPSPFISKDKTKDGRIIDVQVDWDYIRDERNLITGFISIITDITDRKRTEQELRSAREGLERRVQERTVELARTIDELEGEVRNRIETEKALAEANDLLEKMFSSMELMVVYMNRDFNYIRVNRAFAEADGRDADFFVGKNQFEVYPDKKTEAIFRNVVKTGKPASVYEKPFVHPDHPEWGVMYWDWSVQPVMDVDGKVSGLVFCLNNVTDRFKARQEVENERRRLFAVLNMLPGYVYLVGADYSVRYTNHTFLELFGKPGNEPCYKRVRGFDRPCPSCPIQRIIASQSPATWEWSSDEGQCFKTYAYPFTDVDGSQLVLKLGVDITERKLLEKEVLEAGVKERRRIGQDLHDSLGQMLTGIAFLNKVLHGKLARQSLPEADAAEEIAKQISASIVLTRSLSRGLFPVKLEEEGLMEALREYATDTEELFGISCNFKCDRNIMISNNVTAIHLYHIAQEAVNNGIRHGKARSILISLEADDETILLTVKDDGEGLPAKFDRHKGMGMRIMEYRAEMIGGTFDARSSLDGGTIVRCTFRNQPSAP